MQVGSRPLRLNTRSHWYLLGQWNHRSDGLRLHAYPLTGIKPGIWEWYWDSWYIVAFNITAGKKASLRVRSIVQIVNTSFHSGSWRLFYWAPLVGSLDLVAIVQCNGLWPLYCSLVPRPAKKSATAGPWWIGMLPTLRVMDMAPWSFHLWRHP